MPYPRSGPTEASVARPGGAAVLAAPLSFRRRAPGEQRGLTALAIAIASGLLLVQEGAITGSDGAAVYQVARSLVEDQSITIDAGGVGIRGLGGEFYSRYGIGLSLLAVVPYVLAWPFARLSGHAEAIEQAAVASLMPVVSAVLVVAVYRLARRLGGEPRASLLVAVGALFGTFLLPYSKEFFGEPAVALGLVVAIERALARHPAQAAAALAGAALVRPQVFVVAPLLLLFVGQHQTTRTTIRCLAPLALALLVTLAYNLARFGSAASLGYQDTPGFNGDFGEGAAGLLWHPEKSLLLFAPLSALTVPAAAHVWRHGNRAVVALLAANFATVFALDAAWFAWDGGWCWGPRLLLPGLVPALALIAPWIGGVPRRFSAVTALALLGFVISAPAMLVSTRAQQLDRPIPERGPRIVRQAELIVPIARYSVETASAGKREPGAGNHRRYLSLWQVGAVRELGAAGLAVAIPLSLLLATITAAALWRFARELRHVPRPP